jgi:hypothetical protein
MKINLPNPDEYVNDIMGFLDQMELSVHHARKSAEKILSKYSLEDIKEGNDTPWITLRIPAFDENNELSKALEEADPDRIIEKEIILSIEEA